MKTSNVLVVARLTDPTVNEVRNVVSKLMARGLIQQFAWIDIDNPTSVFQADGNSTKKSLEDWVTYNIATAADLRMVVFQPLSTRYKVITGSEMLQRFSDVELFRTASLRSISIVVPARETTDVDASVFPPNRLSLVLSPGDGLNPDSPSVPIHSGDDVFFGHSAVGLVSIIGAWRGQSTSLLQEVSGATHQRESIRLVRSFVRHVDASDLVAEVISSGLTKDLLGYETYDSDGTPFVRIQPQAAKGEVEIVAENFAQAYKDRLLLQPFQPFKPTPRQGRTVKQLIREYFRFLGSLIQTPGEWAREKYQELNALAAKKVNDLFLGNESQYEVFVNGISGSPNSSEEVEQLVMAADTLRGSVKKQAPANPGNLWRDMADVTTSLLDAGEIASSVELPMVTGGSRQVVGDPENLAGPEDLTDFPLSPNLPIKLAGRVIHSSDPYLFVAAKSQIREKLEEDAAALKPNQQVALADAQVQLEAWGQKQRSFLWAVGLKLAESINTARQLATSETKKQTPNTNQESLIQMEAKVRKSFMRMALGALGVILISGLIWLVQALFLFFTFKVWPVLATNWGMYVLLVLGLLTVWITLGGIIFDRQVRELFALQHKQNEATRRSQYEREKQLHMMNEIIRLGDLYRQFKIWKSLITHSVHHPLPAELNQSRADNLVGGLARELPKSFASLKLEKDQSRINDLADKVRRQYFVRGWLFRTLEEQLTNLGGDATRIWTENAEDPKHTLHKVVRTFSANPGEADRNSGNSRAYQLAVKNTDYMGWPLEERMHGENQNITDFFGELEHKQQAFPADQISNAALVRGGLTEIDGNLSKLLVDKRVISGNGPIVATGYSPFEGSGAREVDLMAVRVDVSGELRATDFSFINPSSLSSNTETAVQESEEVRDSLPEVEG